MAHKIGATLIVTAVTLGLARADMSPATAAAHEDAPVTFEDVLANPNDVEISIKWAKRQIKENRLEQAAASLERVLIVAPNADEVRLLYGVVLYRLGNLIEAKAELDLLANRDLSEQSALTRDRYLALIDDDSKQWSFDATFGFGLHYDSNRNFSPISDIAFVNGIAFDLNGNQQDDVGALAFLGVGAHYDPQSEFVDEVYGRFVGVTDKQFKVDALDLQGLSATVGAKGGYQAARLEGSFGTDVIRFDGDNVADVYRATARAEFPLKDPAFVTPFVDARMAYEDFDSPRNGRDGSRFELGGGVEAIIQPNVKATGRFSLDVKDADDASEDFVAPEFEFALLHALPGGQAVQVDFSYRHERYREADQTVINRKRRDDEIEFGVKYVAAIDRLFRHWELDFSEAVFEDMRFTAGASFLRNNSNIDNFEFTNGRVESLVTKTFRF